MKRDVHQEVTDLLIKRMEDNNLMPWESGFDTPLFTSQYNYATGNRYSGINTVLLNIANEKRGFKHNKWMTYKQAQAVGGQVRKGETCTHIIMAKDYVCKEKDANGEPVIDQKTGQVATYHASFCVYHAVFNVQQIDGIELPAPVVVSLPDSQNDRIAAAEGYFAGVLQRIHVEHRKFLECACYKPLEDRVVMPHFEQFDLPEVYYATLAHECAHATGHVNRLNRLVKTKFGTSKYAKEELVAEFAAAMVMAGLGLSGKTLDHNAAYLKGWHAKLKADKSILISAVSLADKAVALLDDYAGVYPRAELSDTEFATRAEVVDTEA